MLKTWERLGEEFCHHLNRKLKLRDLWWPLYMHEQISARGFLRLRLWNRPSLQQDALRMTPFRCSDHEVDWAWGSLGCGFELWYHLSRELKMWNLWRSLYVLDSVKSCYYTRIIGSGWKLSLIQVLGLQRQLNLGWVLRDTVYSCDDLHSRVSISWNLR
jgi:hypothetical protein